MMAKLSAWSRNNKSSRPSWRNWNKDFTRHLKTVCKPVLLYVFDMCHFKLETIYNNTKVKSYDKYIKFLVYFRPNILFKLTNCSSFKHNITSTDTVLYLLFKLLMDVAAKTRKIEWNPFYYQAQEFGLPMTDVAQLNSCKSCVYHKETEGLIY